MKRQLDLRSGRSVWMAYPTPSVPSAALVRDTSTEVLIVGMGLSAAMLADALTQDGRQVMLVDRRPALSGSTTASSAMVEYELDLPLTLLAERIGSRRAERAWRRSRVAVANLSARVEQLGIRCGMKHRMSLLLAGQLLRPEGLRAEGASRRALGLDSEFLSRTELKKQYGIARSGALLSSGNLTLNPRQLAAGLLRCALARGARAHAPTEVTALDADGREVRVATASGPVIHAKHVMLATGYELVDLVPPTAHEVHSTWVIATRRQERRRLWPERATIWEAASPYLYVRATNDGRVICGGEDEPFADEERRDALIPDKTARLEAKLAELFPQLDARAQFAWTGSFGTTRDGLPLIGPLPRHPRVHAVMGYGGNGITFARIAAEILRSHIAGTPDADADLFAFSP